MAFLRGHRTQAMRQPFELGSVTPHHPIPTFNQPPHPTPPATKHSQEQRAEAAELVAARMTRLEQRAEAAELLATERGKQVTALQQRIDSAGSQVAERAKQMAVFKERAERAKFLADQRTKQVCMFGVLDIVSCYVQYMARKAWPC